MYNLPRGNISYSVSYGNNFNDAFEDFISQNRNSQNNLYLEEQNEFGDEYYTENELELNNLLLMYWREYLYWIRMVATDIIYELPQVEASLDRLLNTANTIPNLYGQFYGDQAAGRFNTLLTNNILITVDLIQAIKSNNIQEIRVQEEKWLENAEGISMYYESINPAWNAQTWMQELSGLLEAITEMTLNMINNNHQKSIAIFDEMLDKQLGMIIILFNGITMQFPEYFK